MARRGELQQEDHYWHEGMGDWLPLSEFVGREAWGRETAGPPSALAPPLNRRVILGGLATLIIVAAVVGFLVIKPDRNEIAATPAALPSDAATELQLREKAAADLRQRIERLPATAKPPLNTFYYDVRVSMKKHFNPHIPWSAFIHGSANTVDSENGQTLSRTDFDLTTDYEDEEWGNADYQATVSTFSEKGVETSKEVQDSAAPASIVGMMGLKLRPKAVTSQVPSLIMQDAAPTSGSSPAILAPPILTRPPGK